MGVLDTAMVDSMVDMDTGPMVPTPTPMDTMARGPLRPSLRLRLMPTTLDMVDSMVPILMPTTERGPLMPSPRLMPTMLLTDMVSPMLDTAMPVLPMVMVPTPMPMVPMPTASKMSS